jgi:hypothetical protein
VAKKQTCWEDVETGTELPVLPKVAHSLMSVKWAGAVAAFNPHMYEDAFAKSQGSKGPILHGQLKLAWLVQLVTSWMGEEGTLKKISCEYRGIDYPRLMKTMNEPQEGETWLCKGKVTKKYIEAGEHRVDLEIGVENGKGEITTPGSATVTLPSRCC